MVIFKSLRGGMALRLLSTWRRSIMPFYHYWLHFLLNASYLPGRNNHLDVVGIEPAITTSRRSLHLGHGLSGMAPGCTNISATGLNLGIPQLCKATAWKNFRDTTMMNSIRVLIPKSEDHLGSLIFTSVYLSKSLFFPFIFLTSESTCLCV